MKFCNFVQYQSVSSCTAELASDLSSYQVLDSHAHAEIAKEEKL